MNSTFKLNIFSLLFISLTPMAQAFMPQVQSATEVTASESLQNAPVIQHAPMTNNALSATQSMPVKSVPKANTAPTAQSTPKTSNTPKASRAPVAQTTRANATPVAQPATVVDPAEKSPVFTSPLEMEIIEERPLVAGQPTSFVIYLHDKVGAIKPEALAPSDHSRFRLTLIDPSLSQLLSLYPTVYDSKGHYKFNMTFEKAGKYEVIAEVMDKEGFVYMPNAYLTIPGEPDTLHKATHLAAGTLEPHQQIGNINFSATTTTKQIRADQLVILDITAKYTTGEFHKGLQAYMGHYAHLIGINEKRDILIHADPITPAPTSAKELGGPDVRFKLRFPEAGYYRLWAQFHIDGKPVIVPYDLEVLP